MITAGRVTRKAVAVIDMSGIALGITGESSMAGGNTSSVNPHFSPPGSPSEAYDGAEVHDHPELDLGETWTPASRQHAGADAFAGHGFADPDMLPDTDGWVRV